MTTHPDTVTTDDGPSDTSPPQAAPAPPGDTRKTPSPRGPGNDTRSARAFARVVLARAQSVAGLDRSDMAILERLAGERGIKGDRNELVVVLSTGGSAAADARTALTTLSELIETQDPYEAMVTATTLAVETPGAFREAWALARELGLHDATRVPAGSSVKSAQALCQTVRGADTTTTTRLSRLAAFLD